ncbi:MAG: PIG-L family deacetylase [Clostridia bacterium]|nr:PIG-L family deacetylase [Clostridia bacterium]
MRRAALLVLVLLLVCLCAPACAQEARDITDGCTITGNGGKQFFRLHDGDYATFYNMKNKNGILTIESPEEIRGLYIKLYDRLADYEVQVADGEDWKTVASGGKIYVDYFSLPEGTTKVRLAAAPTPNYFMRISELIVYSAGEIPESVQRWDILDKADLMLLVAHPDDELLWFAGFLPYYAGERGYAVQVAYLVPTGGVRKLELLDGLWHCGITHYPELMGFVDKRGSSLKNQYERWGESKVLARVITAIRRYQPEVLVTQGEKGEYGHPAHKVAADASKRAFTMAANPESNATSAAEYGVWQVKKLYLHEYEEGKIVFDWHVPLAAFGGKDAYTVAVEALACHASQVQRGWEMEDPGTHDNRVFGLYASMVGADTQGDIMENIPEDQLSTYVDDSPIHVELTIN